MYNGSRPTVTKWVIWLTVLMTLLATVVPSAWADDISQTQGFRKAVTVEGIREHQAALQSIADANGGTRASGTPGYDDSAQYVYDKLVATGYYEVSFQEFTYEFRGDLSAPILQEVSPTPTVWLNGTDFATMDNSGSGDVTAPVVAVDLVLPPSPTPNTSTSGCEAADFAGFPAGNIALMQRGTCSFAQKTLNAQAAGATAAIIFNEGNPGSPDRIGVLFGTLGITPINFPAVGTSFAVGQQLSYGVSNGATGAVAHLKTEVGVEERTSRNVIAETPNGDPNRAVVVGAHLDSVAAGPGIQDNGSGSATILEVAEVYAAQERDPRNQLRFIWFGAEEDGLVGSFYYVESLSQAEQDAILAMLNFDMIGSPNFVRFVYDGSEDSSPGSGLIENVFLDYFAHEGLATQPTPFDGRSDYGPFIDVGIPAGGLFTGAEGTKTAAQAALYGGTAGIAYDPCYHRACDTYDNVSLTALDQMSDAVAHATLYFAKTKDDVRAVEPEAAAVSGAKVRVGANR